jgi:hypothetical protein
MISNLIKKILEIPHLFMDKIILHGKRMELFISQWKADLILFNQMKKIVLKKSQKVYLIQCLMKRILFNVIIFYLFLVVVPTVDVICNYCKNILITAKMEKEVAIISLVYIERLLLHSGTFMNSKNWRRITFISLVT